MESWSSFSFGENGSRGFPPCGGDFVPVGGCLPSVEECCRGNYGYFDLVRGMQLHSVFSFYYIDSEAKSVRGNRSDARQLVERASQIFFLLKETTQDAQCITPEVLEAITSIDQWVVSS